MAEAKEDYIAEEEVQHTDLNDNAKNTNDGGPFRDDTVLGEAVDVATAGNPLPVFQDQTDTSDRFFQCDADDTAKLKFHGFALTGGVADDSFEFQGSGIVRGFSGLSKGKKYYVQDDGTIGTTAGTNEILVGTAISTSEILIKKGKRYAVGTDGKSLSRNAGAGDTQTTTINTGFRPTKISLQAGSTQNNGSHGSGQWTPNGQTYTSVKYDSGALAFINNTTVLRLEADDNESGGDPRIDVKIINVTDTSFDIEYSRPGNGNESTISASLSYQAEGSGI